MRFRFCTHAQSVILKERNPLYLLKLDNYQHPVTWQHENIGSQICAYLSIFEHDSSRSVHLSLAVVKEKDYHGKEAKDLAYNGGSKAKS